MTTTTYENTIHVGTTTYRVLATADPDLVVELEGRDRQGERVAEGSLRLPSKGGGAVGRFLAQLLESLSGLGSPPTRVRAPRAANANQPWTATLDTDLRAAWLSAEPLTEAAPLIKSLAAALERSPTAIRARLARVGCDPDVPSRALSPQAAEVLNLPPAVLAPPTVQGRVQGGPQGEA
ncbi:hypothetical protein [Actinosynnema sp. NPDC020468]|uniref:hypothetical protein n=1 Tax=Actinosynnema sp. NPDC020468 TaxID=3154488 RepID=UPI00340A6C11